MQSKFLYPIFLLLIGFAFSSCKKDHGILGADVQPAADLLNAQKGIAFPMEAFSVKYDSILSLNTDDKFLGFNNDPNTGKMDVGLYLNTSIGISDFSFGSTSQLIGGELILAVSNTNYIGSANATLSYSVYTLDSALTNNRPYFSSNTRLYNKQNIVGTGQLKYIAKGANLFLSLPLNNSFSQELFNNTPALVSNDSYQAAYKGFYIKTSCPDSGIIYQCNLAADTSGFYIRYKKNPTDTFVTHFKFNVNGSAVTRFNTVKFEPINTLQAQFNGDSASGANKIFVKGMGGSRVKVKIPFLKNYGDSFKVAVNRAEVIFYPDPVFFSYLNKDLRLPPKLALLASDSLGRETLTIDQKGGTYISRYDGTYDADNHRYLFNIPLHAQAILKGRLKNYGFFLVMADPDPLYAGFRDRNIESCVLGGFSSPSKPIFNIDYIRLTND